jgi:Glycosyl hydrolases family 39.
MHANPKRAWMEMGSPTYLDREQIQALMKASELIKEPVDWTLEDNGITIDLLIQPHSVVAISFVPED